MYDIREERRRGAGICGATGRGRRPGWRGRLPARRPFVPGAEDMNNWLFKSADFLSRPPGFYFVIILMVFSTALVPFGLTEVITYALSVAAILITGVVLIQGYRDTAAIHAKLDEIVVALHETRNDVVGLEHKDPEKIKEAVDRLEQEAGCEPE
jgi:low affinity Fe/Cu permease